MGCGGCRQGVTVNLDKYAKIKAPAMDSDGSIVFPEGEAVLNIEGYTPDVENPQRLIPDVDSACSSKITGIMLQKDGSYKPIHVCRESKCEHSSKPVTPSICQGCPFRKVDG
jgi:hypothetical protein